MARKKTINLDPLKESNYLLVEADYRQKVRAALDRWQERIDVEKEMYFTVRKLNNRFVILRLR